MASDFVRDQFYYGGRIREVGQPIEVENAADRNSLRDRGLIGEKAVTQAPENKAVLGAPEAKGGVGSARRPRD